MDFVDDGRYPVIINHTKKEIYIYREKYGQTIDCMEYVCEILCWDAKNDYFDHELACDCRFMDLDSYSVYTYYWNSGWEHCGYVE